MGRFAKTIKKSDDEREIKEILESQRFVDEILVLLKMLWSKEWKENVGITTEAINLNVLGVDIVGMTRGV